MSSEDMIMFCFLVSLLAYDAVAMREQIPGNWTLAMKVADGQTFDGKSVLDLWLETTSHNEGDTDALSLDSGSKTYRSQIVQDWSNINAVRVSFVVNGTENAYVVFNAQDSTKGSWFSKTRILSSSWNDLGPHSDTNYDSIYGYDVYQRTFYMNHYFDTCPRDNGWFVVVDTHNSGRCTWEQNRHNPHFLYSEGTQAKDSKDYSVAEVFAIWVLEADIFSWSPYGHCSRSCDTGMMIRMRTCHIPDLAGALSPCSHYTHVSETTNCNNKSCPIDGAWSMWDDWGPCSTTCGNGSQQRTRNCTDPSPQHGGADCDENSSTDQQTCYIDDCPIDGAWSTWDDWGPCSTTCGNGTQQRTRNCSDPSPQHGGADCDIITATATANQTCNTGDCPVDGGWSTWSDWGSCSTTCGNGTQQRIRNCTHPSPQHGGSNCDKTATTAIANQICKLTDCQFVCSEPSGTRKCPCPPRITNMTMERLAEAVAMLKKELTVDKTQTNMNIRRKTSVMDSRTSANTIGAVGAVLLAIPFVLIILADLSTIYQRLNRKTAGKRKTHKL